MSTQNCKSIVFAAVYVLLAAAPTFAGDGLGVRIAGTWIRETATAQMLVQISEDGGWLTASSTSSLNSVASNGDPIVFGPGVGSWEASGPDRISLSHLQYVYDEASGNLLFVLRMTGEVVFEPGQPRLDAASATFAIEVFPAGFDIVPGTGFPAGVSDNEFRRAP